MTALRKLLDDYHRTSGLVDRRGFHRLELLAPQLAEALLAAMEGLRQVEVASTCASSRGTVHAALAAIEKIMGE